MAKIRSDLEGVVHAYTADGSPLGHTLAAGDDVPNGVVVGDHLLEQKPASKTAAKGKKPAGGGGGEGEQKPASKAD